jgi:hypothetical protein
MNKLMILADDMTEENKESTQDFLVLDILVSYCGKVLTPDLVDEIAAKLKNEMRT